MTHRELQWGETPWDALSREELLPVVWRLFLALQATAGVVDMARTTEMWPRLNPAIDQDQVGAEIDRLAALSPFWGPGGRGGRTVEMARQALVVEGINGEDFYRSFSRYAHDLLFEERNGVQIGFGWMVCDACGQMLGRGSRGSRMSTGTPCAGHGLGQPGCMGAFRPLAWSDLRPPTPPQGDVG